MLTLVTSRTDNHSSGGCRNLKVGNRNNNDPLYLKGIQNAIGLAVSVIIG